MAGVKYCLAADALLLLLFLFAHSGFARLQLGQSRRRASGCYSSGQMIKQQRTRLRESPLLL